MLIIFFIPFHKHYINEYANIKTHKWTTSIAGKIKAARRKNSCYGPLTQARQEAINKQINTYKTYQTQEKGTKKRIKAI